MEYNEKHIIPGLQFTHNKGKDVFTIIKIEKSIVYYNYIVNNNNIRVETRNIDTFVKFFNEEIWEVLNRIHTNLEIL